MIHLRLLTTGICILFVKKPFLNHLILADVPLLHLPSHGTINSFITHSHFICPCRLFFTSEDSCRYIFRRNETPLNDLIAPPKDITETFNRN